MDDERNELDELSELEDTQLFTDFDDANFDGLLKFEDVCQLFFRSIRLRQQFLINARGLVIALPVMGNAVIHTLFVSGPRYRHVLFYVKFRVRVYFPNAILFNIPLKIK